MLYKRILPETFDFGQSSVQIIKTAARGFDKQAMRKRASAFDDVISELTPQPGYTYLHVITTGASEQYGPNANGDAWNGYAHEHIAPFPKQASLKVYQMQGGLQQFHDTTYMKHAKVYQQHKTQRDGAKSSGFVKAARYNKAMHRGELIIAVDNDQWRDRLHKKASGQDIFLSVGADLKYDVCSYCHNIARSLDQHCGHIKRANLAIDQNGQQVYMINDAPRFYDISGVNVPADKMAFVIRKVASGATVQSAIQQARYTVATRKPLPMTKLAAALRKLSNIEKQLICRLQDDQLFRDDPQDKKIFILKVKNFPVDQIISGCNRKGILLTPDMFFKLLGKQSNMPESFQQLADSCCADCSNLIQRVQDDPLFTPQLLNGSFDTPCVPDLNLQNILEKFMPTFGVTRPAMQHKSIHITISGKPDKVDQIGAQLQSAIKDIVQKVQGSSDDSQDCPKGPCSDDLEKKASDMQSYCQRTYARYLLGFASANSDDTCRFALQKLARYSKYIGA